MRIRYRCLILDHDDTAVRSTPEIHYPSFIKALSVLRPDMEPFRLEDFILHCFEPGFSELCKDVLRLNDEEQEYQYKVWLDYTRKVPEFYPGFADLLKEYKKLGGIITVVSHSESRRIERDYRARCGIIPDLIFGWELEAHQRKPNPYPVDEIIKRFGLERSEILVVDDLKPGLVMAKRCGVEFAAAGWSHSVEKIRNYMMENADYYFSTIDKLREHVIQD